MLTIRYFFNGFVGRLVGKRLLIALEDCNLSAAIQVEADDVPLVK